MCIYACKYVQTYNIYLCMNMHIYTFMKFLSSEEPTEFDIIATLFAPKTDIHSSIAFYNEYIYLYICTHVRMYIRMYACTCVYVHACMYVCIYMYVSTCVYMHVCIHVCTFACIYACTHKYAAA